MEIRTISRCPAAPLGPPHYGSNISPSMDGCVADMANALELLEGDLQRSFAPYLGASNLL